jgi:hypothetical protein
MSFGRDLSAVAEDGLAVVGGEAGVDCGRYTGDQATADGGGDGRPLQDALIT